MFMQVITFFCFCATTMAWLFVGVLLMAILRIAYHKTLNYEVVTDVAVVTSKECENNVLFENDYIINVNYQGKEYSLTNKVLYTGAIVGENIPVRVHKGYNRFNKLCAVYLSEH